MKRLFFLIISVVSASLFGEIDPFDKQMGEMYDTNNQPFKDITNQVLNSIYTSREVKQEIRSHHRKIFSFLYPSDGLKVKGFISFSESNSTCHPLLFLFRGGNRNFALLNPGDKLANHGDYTVIATTLRDGISEGTDEFGGADVDDNKNLIEYLPVLERAFHFSVCPKHTYMIGPSRGGMEMFLTLARFPKLQDHIDKVVSLSGMLDINQMLRERKDMKEMMIDDFGLKPGENEQEWVAKRNPMDAIAKIKKSLPVLIIQGTRDNRVSLDQGYHFIQKMTKEGGHPTYWEVPGGDHTLQNEPQIPSQIFQWLESNE